MRTCLLPIDVEKKNESGSFEGVEKMCDMLSIFKRIKQMPYFLLLVKFWGKYSGLKNGLSILRFI